mgnify:CR=1 FL=1
MPRNRDIHSVLVLGSGPIVIGQGCEFDYSGSQAIKALKQEGIRVNCVLPGTIDTPQNRQDMPKADHSRWVTPAALATGLLTGIVGVGGGFLIVPALVLLGGLGMSPLNIAAAGMPDCLIAIARPSRGSPARASARRAEARVVASSPAPP